MKYPYSVPNIDVITNAEGYLKTIESVRYLDEYKDKVILNCAEHVDEFKRGFICNFVYHYFIVDQNEDNKEEKTDVNKDLLLVYINKCWSVDGFTEFEYIFYK